VRRIGFLVPTSAQIAGPWVAAFREAMSALEWVEKRDYLLDARYGEGSLARQDSLAGDLLTARAEVVVTAGESGVRALLKHTSSVPIVFAIAQDPVFPGVVANLQRPGGNVTGITTLATDLASKRLQLLKEAFPSVEHVAIVYEDANPGNLTQLEATREAAAKLPIRFTALPFIGPGDIAATFARGATAGVQGYLLAQGSLLSAQRPLFLEQIVRLRVPAMFPATDSVVAGGLMGYSPSFTGNFRRAASYVDKILKGARAGDLPIEQPTQYELAVNLKTAREMRLTIPQSLLLRADRVIK
jgi:putative ABC transport system substrate-binding protein